MDEHDELIQIAERALFDAERAYRLDPSDANQRRVMKAWSAVRAARERQPPSIGGGDRDGPHSST